VTLGAQSGLVMALTILLYLTVPVLIAMRGRLIAAGLAMLAIAMLPLAWQILFTDSDAPGFVFLLLMMLPIPLLLTVAGLIAWLVRMWQRLREPRAG
jgi:hypothetical protein